MWLHFSMSIILPLTIRELPWNSSFRLACSDLKNGRMSIKYVNGSILLRQGRGIIDICQYPHYNDSQHRTAHAEVAEMAGPCQKRRIRAMPGFCRFGPERATAADCPIIMTADSMSAFVSWSCREAAVCGGYFMPPPWTWRRT